MKGRCYSIYVKLLPYLLYQCFQLAYGQVLYPTDTNFIRVINHPDKDHFKAFASYNIDSSITRVQDYYHRNTNGHLGLPSAPLFINYQSLPIGFNMLNTPYENDMFGVDDLMYMQTKGPYANLTGIAGSRQEQLFKLLFSGTSKKKLNVTLAFNRYSGLGFYNKQQSFTNNLYLTSNYASPRHRMGYFSYFVYNKVRHQENGGVTDDSLLIDNPFINKMLLPVNLNNAKRELRKLNIDINPWFRLNQREDSSTMFSHFIDYQFHYSGNYTKYSDFNSGNENFYKSFYINPVSTLDSSHWRSISNGLNYTMKINPLHTKLKIGYKHEANQIYQYMDSVFTNQHIDIGTYVSMKDYDGFIKMNYIFKGTNENDYSIETSHRYVSPSSKVIFNSVYVLELNAQIQKRHPDFIFNTWSSNHYAWSNMFKPTEKTQSILSFGTLDKRFKIGVIAQNIENFIYFNEMALPQQTNLSVQNLSGFIQKDVLLFRHLGLNSSYTYQQSSYPSVVCIPNHVLNGSIYYQGNLFKKALQLQLGFSATYFSDFYGYAYMPATNQYYVQTNTKVGNYPFIDLFLNARIKPVRFFVKIDHLNQGFFGTNYSLIPGYFQNDRAFKFGLNWLFFD